MAIKRFDFKHFVQSQNKFDAVKFVKKHDFTAVFAFENRIKAPHYNYLNQVRPEYKMYYINGKRLYAIRGNEDTLREIKAQYFAEMRELNKFAYVEQIY